MRITAIDVAEATLTLDPPFVASWDPQPRDRIRSAVVRVSTDTGLVGVGSGDAMTGFSAYEHLFLGQDPRAIGRHVRVLETVAGHGGRFWPFELALWDLLGQISGQPLAVLLGGAADRVPAYASTGELVPAAERVQRTLAMREHGFRAVKLRIGPGREDEGLAVVRAVREAVGDGMDIMVDLNRGWRIAGDVRAGPEPARARRLTEALGELRVRWVEEPLAGGDALGLAALRQATGVAIAGGEMAGSLAELLGYLDADALDVYQPDPLLTVGMLRTRMVGELAQARHRAFTPHTWTNGVGLMACLHLVAGVGGGPYVEFPYDPPGWSPDRRDFLLREPIDIDADGCLAVPDRPGLGVEIDESRLPAAGR